MVSMRGVESSDEVNCGYGVFAKSLGSLGLIEEFVKFLKYVGDIRTMRLWGNWDFMMLSMMTPRSGEALSKGR